MGFLEAIGRVVLQIVRQTREVFILLAQSLYWIFLGPFKNKRVSSRNFFAQTVFAGIDSLDGRQVHGEGHDAKRGSAHHPRQRGLAGERR